MPSAEVRNKVKECNSNLENPHEKLLLHNSFGAGIVNSLCCFADRLLSFQQLTVETAAEWRRGDNATGCVAEHLAFQ